MAFDFLGTFNRSQYDRFVTYGDKQLSDVKNILTHLVYENLRVGEIIFLFAENGTPLGFNTTGPKTYLGRLFAAYQALGGDPFYDLNLRTKAQAVYLKRGREMNSAQVMSNGEIMGQPGLADGDSAVVMQKMKQAFRDCLKYKRENLEHKIRRAVDYSEQIKEEIDFLTVLLKGVDTEDSWAGLKAQMQTLFENPTYRAIYNDNGTDPHGKLTYAPFKPYFDNGSNPQEREPSNVYGRDLKGATVPGSTKS